MADLRAMGQDASIVALAQMQSGVAAVRAYHGTDLYGHLVDLLDAIKTSYMHELVEVLPEQLLLKQGALRQVIALRAAITASIPSVPKI